MAEGFRVEYSKDRNEVCIIPDSFIPMQDFIDVVKMYGTLGYKYWLPADERCGYIFSKKKGKVDG